jgi:hypothetical protein
MKVNELMKSNLIDFDFGIDIDKSVQTHIHSNPVKISSHLTQMKLGVLPFGLLSYCDPNLSMLNKIEFDVNGESSFDFSN